MAVGVTAVPTPATDMASDLWFAHLNLFGKIGSGMDGGFLQAPLFTVDSKAMRKVDIGQDLVVVVESAVGIYGNGSVLLQAGRMLIKVN